MKTIRLLLAIIIGAALIPITNTTARADIDVYTTPGTHQINGREWRTTCEPYSITERCRTEIKATVVTHNAGTFTPVTGWAFNNLTYKASPRTAWTGNPLGGNGQTGYAGTWTTDGRNWRVECDTALTGQGGCRSFIEASIIEGTTPATYKWATQWIFNNIVRFTPPTPAPIPTPTPAPKPTPSTRPVGIDLNIIPDAGLRAAIQQSAGIGKSRYLTPTAAASITTLDASAKNITTLTGFPNLPNLQHLDLSNNKITTITGLPVLPRLLNLDLSGNQITTVASLATRTGLATLKLAGNPIENLTSLVPLVDAGTKIDIWPSGHFNLGDIADPNLRQCIAQDLGVPAASTVSAAQLASITTLRCGFNTTLAGLPMLPNLEELWLDMGRISDFTLLAQFPKLSGLSLAGSGISDLSMLRDLTGLKWLDLGPSLEGGEVIGENHVSDITPLAELTGLTHLNLAYNQISNCDALAGLTNLTHLDLRSNRVGSVAVLKNLTSMDELSLGSMSGLGGGNLDHGWAVEGNPVADLETLQPLVDNGTEIDIWGQEPTKPFALASIVDPGLRGCVAMALGTPATSTVLTVELSRITYLRCEDQSITSLEGLPELPHLYILSLSNNLISNVTPLSGFTTLVDLDLASNKITDIAPLSALVNLTRSLSLNDNQISIVAPLAGLTGLDYLRLSGNPVSDLTSLQPLAEGFTWIDIWED